MGNEKAHAAAEAAKIEQTNKALRDSIEETARLAEEADKLVEQNRQTLHTGSRGHDG